MIYDPFVCEKTVVDGLTVYWKSVPTSPPIVHFRVLMNVGARHDIAPHYGTAHFFEHMPFDGCEGFPTWNDIHIFDRKILLESLNAWTSMDHTMFSCRSKTEDTSTTADFLGKLMFKPILDEKEVERERSVITQEIWRRYENQKELELTKERRNILYKGHTFEHMLTAAGGPDTIVGITKQSLIEFHKNNYTLPATTLILVGKLDENMVKSIATTFRAHIPDGTARSNVLEPVPTPTQKEHTISRSSYFNLTGDAIPKQTAITLISLHPFESDSSVKTATSNTLHTALNERLRSAFGATYDVNISSYDFIDHTKTVLHTQIDPLKLEEAKKIIFETIDAFIAQDTDIQKIFEEAKQANVNRLLVAEYETRKIADFITQDISMYGAVESLSDTLQKAQTVTYTECAQWLQRNLLPNLVTFIDTP